MSLHAVSKEVRPLKCQGWQVRQNPEFNYLSFDLRPNVQKTAQHWQKLFGYLGQDSDILVQTAHFDVLLHRPICTDLTKYAIHFHCLPKLTYY